MNNQEKLSIDSDDLSMYETLSSKNEDILEDNLEEFVLVSFKNKDLLSEIPITNFNDPNSEDKHLNELNDVLMLKRNEYDMHVSKYFDHFQENEDAESDSVENYLLDNDEPVSELLSEASLSEYSIVDNFQNKETFSESFINSKQEDAEAKNFNEILIRETIEKISDSVNYQEIYKSLLNKIYRCVKNNQTFLADCHIKSKFSNDPIVEENDDNDDKFFPSTILLVLLALFLFTFSYTFYEDKSYSLTSNVKEIKKPSPPSLKSLPKQHSIQDFYASYFDRGNLRMPVFLPLHEYLHYKSNRLPSYKMPNDLCFNDNLYWPFTTAHAQYSPQKPGLVEKSIVFSAPIYNKTRFLLKICESLKLKSDSRIKLWNEALNLSKRLGRLSPRLHRTRKFIKQRNPNISRFIAGLHSLDTSIHAIRQMDSQIAELKPFCRENDVHHLVAVTKVMMINMDRNRNTRLNTALIPFERGQYQFWSNKKNLLCVIPYKSPSSSNVSTHVRRYKTKVPTNFHIMRHLNQKRCSRRKHRIHSNVYKKRNSLIPQFGHFTRENLSSIFKLDNYSKSFYSHPTKNVTYNKDNLLAMCEAFNGTLLQLLKNAANFNACFNFTFDKSAIRKCSKELSNIRKHLRVKGEGVDPNNAPKVSTGFDNLPESNFENNNYITQLDNRHRDTLYLKNSLSLFEVSFKSFLPIVLPLVQSKEIDSSKVRTCKRRSNIIKLSEPSLHLYIAKLKSFIYVMDAFAKLYSYCVDQRYESFLKLKKHIEIENQFTGSTSKELLQKQNKMVSKWLIRNFDGFNRLRKLRKEVITTIDLLQAFLSKPENSLTFYSALALRLSSAIAPLTSKEIAEFRGSYVKADRYNDSKYLDKRNSFPKNGLKSLRATRRTQHFTNQPYPLIINDTCNTYLKSKQISDKITNFSMPRFAQKSNFIEQVSVKEVPSGHEVKLKDKRNRVEEHICNQTGCYSRVYEEIGEHVVHSQFSHHSHSSSTLDEGASSVNSHHSFSSVSSSSSSSLTVSHSHEVETHTSVQVVSDAKPSRSEGKASKLSTTLTGPLPPTF